MIINGTYFANSEVASMKREPHTDDLFVVMIALKNGARYQVFCSDDQYRDALERLEGRQINDL